jgi:hypothetical protein
MKCPNCTCHADLYKSGSGTEELSTIARVWFVAVRCHRCSNLFRVPRIMASNIPSKSRKSRLSQRQAAHKNRQGRIRD